MYVYGEERGWRAEKFNPLITWLVLWQSVLTLRLAPSHQHTFISTIAISTHIYHLADSKNFRSCVPGNRQRPNIHFFLCNTHLLTSNFIPNYVPFTFSVFNFMGLLVIPEQTTQTPALKPWQLYSTAWSTLPLDTHTTSSWLTSWLLCSKFTFYMRLILKIATHSIFPIPLALLYFIFSPWHSSPTKIAYNWLIVFLSLFIIVSPPNPLRI